MKRVILIMILTFLIGGVLTGKETRREKRKVREKAKTEQTKQLFDNRSLQFIAQSAHPMGGGMINLTPEYTLDITSSEVISFLPFYGIAYSAEYGSSEGGIKFREALPKGEWVSTRKGYEVMLEVRTQKDTYRLNLFFSQLGYAMLNVACQNRQPISFNGIVQAIPEKK